MIAAVTLFPTANGSCGFRETIERRIFIKCYLSRISISLMTLGLVGLTALTALAAQRVQIRLTIQLLDHERFTATATNSGITVHGTRMHVIRE